MTPDEPISDDLIIEIAPYHNDPTIFINFDMKILSNGRMGDRKAEDSLNQK